MSASEDLVDAADLTFGGLIALVDVDESDFPVMWARLPLPGEVGDATSWAADAAVVMARERHFADDRDAVFRVQALLQLMVGLPMQFDQSLRLLFMPHPDLGGVLWEVVFARPDGERVVTARRLLAVDAAGDLGSDVAEFEHDGLPMLQCVRFFSEPEASSDGDDGVTPNRAIVASAAVAVRREVGRLGQADVVGFATTADLRALAMSLEPLRILLASAGLAAMADSA